MNDNNARIAKALAAITSVNGVFSPPYPVPVGYDSGKTPGSRAAKARRKRRSAK